MLKMEPLPNSTATCAASKEQRLSSRHIGVFNNFACSATTVRRDRERGARCQPGNTSSPHHPLATHPPLKSRPECRHHASGTHVQTRDDMPRERTSSSNKPPYQLCVIDQITRMTGCDGGQRLLNHG
jgi:hypothetical protein